MVYYYVNDEQSYRRILDFIRLDQFSCLAAKTAELQQTIRHRHYPAMAEPGSTALLHSDLRDYCAGRMALSETNATFIATFATPAVQSEQAFEDLLWQQLRLLNCLDEQRGYSWHEQVEKDPASPRFSYCVIGEPFFIVGLHPFASRTSRRAPMAAIAFNSHLQFNHLKRIGAYPRLQQAIRAREMALDGCINPNLVDYGSGSEARQYSGMAVSSTWQCPFTTAPITQENNEQ